MPQLLIPTSPHDVSDASAAPQASDEDLPRAEAWAEALAHRWAPFTVVIRPDLRIDDRDLTAPAAAAGDLRPQWLGLCLAGLHHAEAQPLPQAVTQARALVAQMHSHGWPRAVRLAEAGLAMALLRTPGQGREALDLLLTHGAPAADGRPAIERIWTDRTLATAAVECGELDLALQVALQARELSSRIADPLIHSLADFCLQFVLFSAGNSNDALVVLRRYRQTLEAGGVPISRMWLYNVGLAELLQRRPEATLATLGEPVRFRGASTTWMRSLLQVLQAAALAATGQIEPAMRLIEAEDLRPLESETQASLNRLWLVAQVHLAAGQPARALAMLRSGLDADDASPAAASPLNGTHLQRTLSQAFEALGDEAGAFRALKRSQRHCEVWVAQSVRSRIMTQLYGEHTDNPRLQQRLHTLAKAAGAPARANGVTAGDAGTDATASSAPPAECSADAADRSSGWPWTQPPRPPVDPVRHVAEVAHELRNPLNGVIGFTSLLALSDLDQRQRTYAEGAQTSAQMLLRLCNQLLDLSALDAGHFRLSLAAVDARALAQETAAVLQPLADARAGLKLRVDCASDLPGWLELDASRVQQILMNLLGNALKFTLRGEVVVQVGWRPGDAPANEAASTRAAAPGDRGQLCLAVQDTGCGIDNRLLEHLFDEFTQADVHDNRGAGLGLAISRRIAQAMHGSLNACSRPGVGSRFELRVPTVVLTPDAATRNDLAQASPAGTNGPAPQRTQPLSPLSP